MAKSRKKRGRRKQPFKFKLPPETIYTISSIILMLIGGLILVSLSRQRPLLILIYNYFTNLFGWGIFLLPFIFISAALMLTRLKWRVTKPNVFIGSLILLLSSVSLTKSGFIGSQIWFSLSGLIYSAGAFLVLFAGVFLSLVIIFETSLEDLLLTASQIANYLKDSFQKIRSARLKTAQPETQDSDFTVKGLADEPETEPTEPAKPASDTDQIEPAPAALKPAPASSLNKGQKKIWRYPPISLLSDENGGKADRGDVKKNAATIEQTLDSFGINAKVVEVNRGPAVTQYAIRIAQGTKLSKITSLQNDLALALAAPQGQIRIEAPIPGRALVGLEIPNYSLELVTMKKILTSSSMKQTKSKLAFGLGLDVSGKEVIADIDKMPHVLIAGATGSGKSVCINSLISTVLFRATPEEIKLILVDPKRVELTQYNDIPHLLTPVIIEPEKVVSALKWAISEMENRYKMFSQSGARNISSYNEIAGFQALPYILIIIDELADIILFAPSEVEDTITRLAQMARATGIHLVVATQRPSVDVLTGLIKANINCRISFNVNSMVDSRVIIDMPGAEKLLGRGDMLYIPPDQAKPSRIQGTYIVDKDIKKLINFLKQSEVEVEYTEEVTKKFKAKTTGSQAGPAADQELDELYDDAVRVVCRYERASASLLQRRLSIGYARAARILDQLERLGVIGPADGSKARDILISNPEEYIAKRHSQS